MKITIEFDTDNAAFHEHGGEMPEVISILQRITDRISMYSGSGTVRDSNGNTIGQWSLTREGQR